MICRLCYNDLPLARFQTHRKVCKSCRVTKQRNPETVRKNALRAWHKKYDLNKEDWNAKVRAYRMKRKQEGRPLVRNCASDKYRKTGRFKLFQRAEVYYQYGPLCFYCLEVSDQIDHIVPLAAGGTNDLENLVPACKSCNSSKQDKPLLVWLAERKRGYSYRNQVCR